MSIEAMKLALEQAYLAGFNASADGYNGECGVGDPSQCPQWLTDRNNYVSQAIEQAQKQEPVEWMTFIPLYTAPLVASSDTSQERVAETAKQEHEPVAWRNAALRVGEDLCSVGPFGYYDMTAEQWLDWALSVVTVHAPPPPRQLEPVIDKSAAIRIATALGWTPPQQKQEPVALKHRLVKIHDALCNKLGDTDPYIDEDMTDEEICKELPVFWAAKEIADLIGDAPWTDYTSPPQRQPLTDEQMKEKYREQMRSQNWEAYDAWLLKQQNILTDNEIMKIRRSFGPVVNYVEFARAIEAAHGIKGEA